MPILVDPTAPPALRFKRMYVWRQSLGKHVPVHPVYIWIGTPEAGSWRTADAVFTWVGKAATGTWRQVYEPEVDTTTTLNSISNHTSGTTFTLSGTVTSAFGGVAEGTVSVYRKMQSQGDGSYALIYSGIPLNGGNWSRSHTQNDVGAFSFQARYVPPSAGSPLQASSSAARLFTTTLAAMGLLYTVAQAQTSCRFNWTAVKGATSYEVYNGGGLVKTVTSPDSGTISVSANTTYSWRVRARRTSPDSVVYYSAFSPYLYFNGGRSEIRDSGSAGPIQTNPVGTGQYRNDVGWGYVGTDIRQGYFSSPYGGYGYFGLIDYGYLGIRNAVVAAVGGTRAANAWCTGFYVYLARESGVGAWSSNRIGTFTASDSAVNSGGIPSGQWAPVDVTIGPNSSGYVWYNLGTALGTQFLYYQHRSICMRRHNSTDYMSVLGGASHIYISWNYVTQSYIAPSWWR